MEVNLVILLANISNLESCVGFSLTLFFISTILTC